DHEIARRARHLHRQVHRQVHRRPLQRPAADAQQPGDHAGHEHEPERRDDAGYLVAHLAAQRGVVVRAIEVEARRESTLGKLGGHVEGPLPEHHDAGVGQDRPEDEVEGAAGDQAGDVGPGDRGGRRGHRQEEANPQGLDLLTDVGRGGAAGRGDDGDDAGADRIVDVDAEEQGQHRDDDDPAPEPKQRPSTPAPMAATNVIAKNSRGVIASVHRRRSRRTDHSPTAAAVPRKRADQVARTVPCWANWCPRSRVSWRSSGGITFGPPTAAAAIENWAASSMIRTVRAAHEGSWPKARRPWCSNSTERIWRALFSAVTMLAMAWGEPRGP